MHSYRLAVDLWHSLRSPQSVAPGLLTQIWSHVRAWTLPMLTGAASAVAIVVFIQGGLRLRQRPEARIEWLWSSKKPYVDFPAQRPWAPSRRPCVPPGAEFAIRVQFTNIGDGATDYTLWNFVVPAAFDVRMRKEGVEVHEGIFNPIVGGPGKLIWSNERWIVSVDILRLFIVTVPLGTPSGSYQVYFELQDNRFNATGRRIWPSLMTKRPHWFPESWKRPGRWPGWIKVEPKSIETRLGFRGERAR